MLSNENGTFIKKQGYTVTMNSVARDKNLSEKALGLYIRIASWITFESDNFVLTKEFLFRQCMAGEKAFDNMWIELKEVGYLKQHIRPSKGSWDITYELLDTPDKSGIHTIYYNAEGKKTTDNLMKKAKKLNEIDHTPQNGGNGNETVDHTPPFGSNGKNSNGNGGGIKNNTLNINTECNISNQIISNNTVEEMINTIKDKISYDCFEEAADKAIVDNIVTILVGEVYSKKDSDSINVGSEAKPDIKSSVIVKKVFSNGLSYGAVKTYLQKLRKYGKPMTASIRYHMKSLYKQCLECSTVGQSQYGYQTY